MVTERIRSSMAMSLADYAQELQRFRDDEARLKEEEQNMLQAQKAEADRMAWLQQEQDRLKSEMEAAQLRQQQLEEEKKAREEAEKAELLRLEELKKE